MSDTDATPTTEDVATALAGAVTRADLLAALKEHNIDAVTRDFVSFVVLMEQAHGPVVVRLTALVVAGLMVTKSPPSAQDALRAVFTNAATPKENA